MRRLFVTATSGGEGVFEQLRARTLHRFKHLPIAVIDAADDAASAMASMAGLNVHAATYDSYLPLLDHLDRLAVEGAGMAVNISISHGPGPFDPQEPVNVATRIVAARGAVLVFAVGNDGPGEGTLSPWAQAPWVIGVGAAEADGSAPLALSSIGSPGSEGPFVIAHGRTVVPLRPLDTRNHGTMVALVLNGKDGSGRSYPGYVDVSFEGTSVAAPRVARIATLLITVLRLYYELGEVVTAGLPPEARTSDYLLECERLAGLDSLDFPEMKMLHGLAGEAVVPMLRLLAHRALVGASGEDKSMGRPDDAFEPVATTRRMIEAMARPVPGWGRHQVGAGFVSDAIADAWLAQIDGREFIRLLGADGSENAPRAAPPGAVIPTALLERLHALRSAAQSLSLAVV